MIIVLYYSLFIWLYRAATSIAAPFCQFYDYLSVFFVRLCFQFLDHCDKLIVLSFQQLAEICSGSRASCSKLASSPGLLGYRATFMFFSLFSFPLDSTHIIGKSVVSFELLWRQIMALQFRICCDLFTWSNWSRGWQIILFYWFSWSFQIWHELCTWSNWSRG